MHACIISVSTKVYMNLPIRVLVSYIQQVQFEPSVPIESGNDFW